MIRISYPLNKLLTAIARQHQMKESLTDQELLGHELSPAECAALRPAISENSTSSGPIPT